MQLVQINNSWIDRGRTFIENKDWSINRIPVCEIDDIYSLSKIIGHLKYKNQNIGRILYRGQRSLYSGFRPSAYRFLSTEDQFQSVDAALSIKLDKFRNHQRIESFFHAIENHGNNANILYEAVLQHYGEDTRFIDVVDNHWTALWFASHRCSNGIYEKSTEPYSYILLLAVDGENQKGISISKECISIDIRQACPSTVLRPHMQHGLLCAYTDEYGNFLHDYQQYVVAILKIKTETCLLWLDSGMLITQDALFPDKSVDEALRSFHEVWNDFLDEEGFSLTIK